MGREISTLVSQKLSQGVYKSVFESKSLDKDSYILKLISGNISETKRIIVQ